MEIPKVFKNMFKNMVKIYILMNLALANRVQWKGRLMTSESRS